VRAMVGRIAESDHKSDSPPTIWRRVRVSRTVQYGALLESDAHPDFGHLLPGRQKGHEDATSRCAGEEFSAQARLVASDAAASLVVVRDSADFSAISRCSSVRMVCRKATTMGPTNTPTGPSA